MSDKERPINVTSFNQQGGITAGHVNIGPQPRHLNAQGAKQLAQALPKDKKVNVTCIMDDGEGFQFATEIKKHLVSVGMSRPLLKLGGGSAEILRDVRH